MQKENQDAFKVSLRLTINHSARKNLIDFLIIVN